MRGQTVATLYTPLNENTWDEGAAFAYIPEEEVYVEGRTHPALLDTLYEDGYLANEQNER
jgi:hypothetical protein